MKHNNVKNTLLYSSLVLGTVALGNIATNTVHADTTNQVTQQNEGVNIQTTSSAAQSNSASTNNSAQSSASSNATSSAVSSNTDTSNVASSINIANSSSADSSNVSSADSSSTNASNNSSASSNISQSSTTSSESDSSKATSSESDSNKATSSESGSSKVTSSESNSSKATSSESDSSKATSSESSPASTAALSNANDIQSAITSTNEELNRIGSDSTAQSNSQVNSLHDKLSSLQAQLSAASSAAAAASSAEAINNLTADIKTKDVTVTPGSTYDPRESFVSATNSQGQNISFDDLTSVTNNVNTAKGIQPQTYTVTFTYHKTTVTANVNVVNNAGMTLRRNDTDHPYVSYANDNFNQLSLITSLKDDNGNNVDPAQAVNDGRLVLNSDSSSFPEGSGAGYYLTFNYRPDGPNLAPLFQGRVKVYTINNSSAKTNAINIVYGSTYNAKDGISNLVNSEGQAEDYDTAVKNGDLTVTGTDKVSTTTPGTYTLTYNYFGKVYNANVNVLDKSDLGLANATSIKAGTSFDPATGVSAITDATGKSTNYDTVTQDGALKVVGLDKLNTNTPGDYTINYQYAGKDHLYHVVVQSQKSLTYKQNPTAMYAGDSLSPASLFSGFTNDTGQTISYDDAVKNGLQVDLSAVNTNSTGTYIGKAIYGDKEYPIEVQVQAKPVINNTSSAATASTSSSATNNSSSAVTSSSSATPVSSSSSVTNSSSAAINSSSTNNNSSSATINSSSANTNPTDAVENNTFPNYVEKKVGKKVELYLKNATVTYKTPGIDEKSRVGLYGRKAGYAKVYAQLVNTNVGLRYKLSNGQYIDATTNGLTHFVQASAHQVQITRPVKVYRHLFKHSKSVKTLDLGTIVYSDKTIIKNNNPYYKVTSHNKVYYIKAEHNRISSNVGLIKQMDVYIHGQATIYKNAKHTKKAFTLKKTNSVAAKLVDYTKQGNWKVQYSVKKSNGTIKQETGYVKGSELLKANKVYNNVFGTFKK